MKFANFYKVLQILSFLITFACVPAAASDVDDLTAMLNEFLAAADKEPAHRRFWAEDLVYTSSNGTRVNKGEILAGFAGDAVPDAPPPVVYSAEDVDVRVYGAAAVIAFRLVGTPSECTSEAKRLISRWICSPQAPRTIGGKPTRSPADLRDDQQQRRTDRSDQPEDASRFRGVLLHHASSTGRPWKAPHPWCTF